MIGYTLKQILTLAPEALPMVKQASIEEDFPLGNKDSCIASALRIRYDVQIKGQPVDQETMTKVASATLAYGVTDKVNELADLMLSRKAGLEKKASVDGSKECLEKMAHFEGELTGFKDVEALTKTANSLYEASIACGETPTESVLRYSANAYLSKEAALNALQARFQATNNNVFVKLAAALGMEDSILPSGNLVKGLCEAVTKLDKQAGLNAKGFDFYRDSLIVKSAAISAARVKLGGEEFPLETVLRIPKHNLEHYLGDGIAKELETDPITAKAVIESLPADVQGVLVSLIKNS